MLILNEKSAAIAKLAEWYFKTSYVDIKHLVISGLQFQFINFKTSYVDIKLVFKFCHTHFTYISKHHMLILNPYKTTLS